MKRILQILLAALLTLSVLTPAQAEVAQPTEEFWFLDEANVLSEETEGEIFFANERLYEACGAGIVIAAVNSTGRLSMEDYTYQLFNDWNICGDTYRGFLLVMSIEDDDYYAMAGTRLEADFSSAVINDLFDSLEPSFAKKDYDTGARLFFEAVFERMTDVLNVDVSLEDAIADYREFAAQGSSYAAPAALNAGMESTNDIARHERGGWGANMDLILLVIILVVVLVIVLRIFGGRAYRTPPGYAAPPPRRVRWLFWPRYGGFMRGPRPPRRPAPPPPPRGGMHVGGQPHRASRPQGGGFGGFSGAGRGAGPRSFGSSSHRSVGGSHGPATRGGGAGRSGRK